MNKQEIENAIAYWKEFKAEIPELKASYPDAGLGEQEEFVELAISALTQQLSAEPTVIEFLRKAKAICESIPVHHCKECPLDDICGEFGNMTDEADLVRKVMDYRGLRHQ